MTNTAANPLAANLLAANPLTSSAHSVPLLFSLRSWGSLLRGHQPVEKLIDQARKQGWQRFALTEIAELGTCVEAARYAGESAAIVGTQLPCRHRPRSDRPRSGGRQRCDATPSVIAETSALLLPIDTHGLGEVHQTVSDWRLAATTSPVKETAVKDMTEEDTCSGTHYLPIPDNDLEILCALSSCWIITGDPALAEHLLQRNPELTSRLWLEIDRWGSSIGRERQLLELAQQHRLRIIAGSRFGGAPALTAHQTHLLDALTHSSTVDQMADQRRQQHSIPFSTHFSPGQLLPIPTVTEWRQRYRDLPEALAGTEFLARNSCPYPAKAAKTIFPPVEEVKGQTAYGQLYQRCHQGLLRRHGEVQRPMLERLTRELQVIDEMGFVPYFLVVGEIIDEARRLGIASAGARVGSRFHRRLCSRHHPG
ncbi:MAG: hypothetical protein ACJ0DK_05455 [Planctomycetota bacterium]